MNGKSDYPHMNVTCSFQDIAHGFIIKVRVLPSKLHGIKTTNIILFSLSNHNPLMGFNLFIQL